jgi:AhpD family alkylhydroperoxidase
MQARIDNPALTVPGALKALRELADAAKQAGIPETTLELVRLRASQINGCSGCVDLHSRELKHAGEPDSRIHMVAAWRDASYFTDAERAALALTEAATRIADRPDPVADNVWEEAGARDNEAQLAAPTRRAGRLTHAARSVGRARPSADRPRRPGLVGAEARADQIESAEPVIVIGAEQVLFDDLAGGTRLRDAKPVEDVEAIGNHVASGAHELELLCVAEPRRELRRHGLGARELEEAGGNERSHAHVGGQQAGEAREVSAGERSDEPLPGISS